MNLSITSITQRFLPCICLVAMLFAVNRLSAQNLTLEGQTGGFITPTAYVVYSAEGKKLSHPAVGYHFVNTAAVIGNVQTFSITEGIANRAEVGYTRNVHTLGNSAAFSSLWDYSGMNVFHGKVVALKEGKWSELMPGIGVGFVVRTDDHFVSGALDKKIYGVDQAYTKLRRVHRGNEDVAQTSGSAAAELRLQGDKCVDLRPGRAVDSQQWAVSLAVWGFRCRSVMVWAAVPSAGFAQQPPQVVNLSRILFPPGSGAHIPTTMDYAVRVTQRENPHFTFDVGIGQVAGQIGYTAVKTGVANPPYVVVPVDLEARHVLGIGAELPLLMN